MIFFNKKLAAIMLLVGVFGQAAAMKRANDDDSEMARPSKLPRIELSTPKFIIPSGWKAHEVLPIKVSRMSDNKNEEPHLEVSPREISRFYDKQLFPYYHQKLSFMLSRSNVDGAEKYMRALSVLGYNKGIVANIVSSELSNKEKYKLFDVLEKTTNDKPIRSLFNEPDINGETPLRLALVYDDYELAQDLLLRGANPRGINKKGQPALLGIRTIEQGKLLLACGAKIGDTDTQGNTLLHENASNLPEEKAIAAWAITEGISVHQKNNERNDAFQAQNMEYYANPDLEKEEWAFKMAREGSGINPYFLCVIQTGQFKLKRS